MWAKEGEIALKIDISKVFDKVDWRYLHVILLKLGFDSTWVNWMRMCVEYVEFNVLVNGEGVGPILLGRWLRQGTHCTLIFLCNVWRDSLPFYKILREKERSMVWKCVEEPFSSHLFFLTIVFFFQDN